MVRMKRAAHAQLHKQLAQLAEGQGHSATPEQVKQSGQQVLGAYAGHLLDMSKRIATSYREQRKWERLQRYFQIVGRGASNSRAVRGAARREATDDIKTFLRNSMLEAAEVVFSTLSSAARGAMGESVASSGRAFDTVVVDEAGQATEASTLVPLQYGAQQLILIGDPQQLPATVLSRAAADAGLERSLFARLVSAGHPVHLLDMQYRMHPAIAAFPSRHFYDSKVQDAPAVCGSNRVQAFHTHPLMGPLTFFDVRFGQVQHGSGGHSFTNAAEVQVAMALLFGIMDWRGSRPPRPEERVDAKGQVPLQFSGTVGLFTPYDGQSRLLRQEYTAELGRRQAKGSAHPSCTVDISTVDAAQGQERDIVILSTVRAAVADLPAARASDRKASIGFLRDTRRMNVALTRAKYALWVVGNVATLQANPDWCAFVQHCRSEGKVLGVLAPISNVLSAEVSQLGDVCNKA
jgi:senataxin